MAEDLDVVVMHAPNGDLYMMPRETFERFRVPDDQREEIAGLLESSEVEGFLLPAVQTGEQKVLLPYIRDAQPAQLGLVKVPSAVAGNLSFNWSTR
jgi:hypothetical protein